MHTEVQVFLYPKITGKKSEKFALVKICYDFQRNYLLLLFYFENFTMFNTFPKLSALEYYSDYCNNVLHSFKWKVWLDFMPIQMVKFLLFLQP